jgi:uncharacterized protein (DUF608 family)
MRINVQIASFRNQRQVTHFELSFELWWDLNPGLILLYYHYVMCVSFIKILPFINGLLNLHSDALDYRQFFAYRSSNFYCFPYVISL